MEAARGSGGDVEALMNDSRAEGFIIINALVSTPVPASIARAHRIVVPGAAGSICTGVEASDGDVYLEDDQDMVLEPGLQESSNLDVVKNSTVGA